MDSTQRRSRGSLPRFTDRLALGEQGLSVSPFCLGIVRSEETVCAAFDAGINFFFVSADLHWPAYEATRRGLAKLLSRGPSVREQVVIAAASYVTQPWFFTGALLELIEAVRGLEAVDLAVMGGVYSWDFVARAGQYEEARASGFAGARTVGASFHDRGAALLAVNHSFVDIAFVRYNPQHPGARLDIFPRMRSPRSLLYCFKATLGYVKPARYAEMSLGDDYWRPKVTDFYRFALTRPEVDGLLCSPTTPREVEELALALEEGPLDESEEEHLISLAALDAGRAVPALGRQGEG